MTKYEKSRAEVGEKSDALEREEEEISHYVMPQTMLERLSQWCGRKYENEGQKGACGSGTAIF